MEQDNRYSKERFKQLWGMIGGREGKGKVLEYLEKSDYFSCPASSKFHCSYSGGLLEHSIRVAEKLIEISKDNGIEWEDLGSPIVIGLLHDICKTHFYKVEYKNAKDENGKWIQVPYYSVDDRMPIGIHGDKSVMLIQQLGMKLTSEELYCIRYHMGAYEGKEVLTSLSLAKKKYPNILWVCLADELCSLEEEGVVISKNE